MRKILTTEEFERQIGMGLRDFSNVIIEGDVSLRGRKLKGSLSFRKTAVKGGFHFEDARLAGDLDLGAMSTEGDLRLEGSRVGGRLDLTGCRVRGTLDRSASEVNGEEIVRDVQAREYYGTQTKRARVSSARHPKRRAA